MQFTNLRKLHIDCVILYSKTWLQSLVNKGICFMKDRYMFQSNTSFSFCSKAIDSKSMPTFLLRLGKVYCVYTFQIRILTYLCMSKMFQETHWYEIHSLIVSRNKTSIGLYRQSVVQRQSLRGNFSLILLNNYCMDSNERAYLLIQLQP